MLAELRGEPSTTADLLSRPGMLLDDVAGGDVLIGPGLELARELADALIAQLEREIP